jgi:hypothetical protein
MGLRVADQDVLDRGQLRRKIGDVDARVGADELATDGVVEDLGQQLDRRGDGRVSASSESSSWPTCSPQR